MLRLLIIIRWNKRAEKALDYYLAKFVSVSINLNMSVRPRDFGHRSEPIFSQLGRVVPCMKARKPSVFNPNRLTCVGVLSHTLIAMAISYKFAA